MRSPAKYLRQVVLHRLEQSFEPATILFNRQRLNFMDAVLSCKPPQTILLCTLELEIRFSHSTWALSAPFLYNELPANYHYARTRIERTLLYRIKCWPLKILAPYAFPPPPPPPYSPSNGTLPVNGFPCICPPESSIHQFNAAGRFRLPADIIWHAGLQVSSSKTSSRPCPSTSSLSCLNPGRPSTRRAASLKLASSSRITPSGHAPEVIPFPYRLYLPQGLYLP
jgi:hypothetical protein